MKILVSIALILFTSCKEKNDIVLEKPQTRESVQQVSSNNEIIKIGDDIEIVKKLYGTPIKTETRKQVRDEGRKQGIATALGADICWTFKDSEKYIYVYITDLKVTYLVIEKNN